MTYIRASVPYYQSPAFKQHITQHIAKSKADISHYFFTSQCNVADNNLDNLKRIAQQCKLESNRLVMVKQIHSAQVAMIDESNYNQNITADAMVSATKNIGLGIVTADCTPILLADTQAKVIAAIHAGWRSAFAGIVENTIDKMLEIGAKRQSITAIIGPTISQKKYEVSTEFKDNFLAHAASHSKYFLLEAGKYFFNLEHYNLDALRQANIDAYSLGLCTYNHSQHFFSYRRATHLKKPNTGRQLSLITLK